MHNAANQIQAVNCAARQHYPASSPAPLSCINSSQLLGQHGVVTINHQGQLYYLRQTKTGKLILTK
ncbi:hemin uptake protein HemP [Yersinia aldovae]|uniref:hemin uptake protein HemP n=1 Tax=Yersinia aldovae TaxID=29483 RepID=UPI0001A577B1|nr:hemin uptake protein HemP [Yersinia aldovae]EEP96537.1 Hemin uptake protein [Yersinia aldovae ATCC 35236]